LTANQQQKKKKKKCLHAVKHPQMPVLRAILWRGKKKKKVHLPPIVIQTPKFDTCSAVSFESTSIANRERTKKPKKPKKKKMSGVKHPQMPVLRAILWREKKTKNDNLPEVVVQTPKFDTCSAVSFESTSIANRERAKKPKKTTKKKCLG
jgi:hypothetical protein